jgi:hypothetical protein
VSGPSLEAKGIQATFLERLPSVPEILISGAITNLDTTHQTFFIGNSGLLITYDKAQILATNLHEGQPVEIIGTMDERAVLRAIQIRILDINKKTVILVQRLSE